MANWDCPPCSPCSDDGDVLAYVRIPELEITTFSNVFFGRGKLQYDLQEEVARVPVGAFQAQSLELPVQCFSWRPERLGSLAKPM
jgi:hypothetical protein